MIQCAFTDGTSLFVGVPSKSTNGLYLVGVTEFQGKLFTKHSCKAIKHGFTCHHIEKAMQAWIAFKWAKEKLPNSQFPIWHWVELQRPVVHLKGKMSLQEHWRQIPVPQLPKEILEGHLHEYSA